MARMVPVAEVMARVAPVAEVVAQVAPVAEVVARMVLVAEFVAQVALVARLGMVIGVRVIVVQARSCQCHRQSFHCRVHLGPRCDTAWSSTSCCCIVVL